MQPGDNFRVVANGDAAFLKALVNDDPLQNVGATAQIANKHKQLIVDPRIAGGPASQEVRHSSEYVSDVLTVWRFMHVETDSMESVQSYPHPQANTLDRMIASISGNGAVAQEIVFTAPIAGPNHQQDTNGDNVLDMADESPSMSPNPPNPMGNGRFENGWARVGAEPDHVTTSGLDGNGHSFVRRAAGISVPFVVSKVAGPANLTGNVVALAGTTITLKTESAQALENGHNGGVINVAGVEMQITGVNLLTNEVTVAVLEDIPVRIHDDDDDSLLPRLPMLDFVQESDNRLENLFADAYIRPVHDGGGDLNNNQTDIPFILNTSHTDAFYWDSRDNNRASFWVVYVLSAFQPAWDSMKRDDDPIDEKAVFGLTWSKSGTAGIFTYLETLREGAPFANNRPGQPEDFERLTVLHEIGHLLYLDHGDNTDNPGANGVMNTEPFNLPVHGTFDYRFNDNHLHIIRVSEKPRS